MSQPPYDDEPDASHAPQQSSDGYDAGQRGDESQGWAYRPYEPGSSLGDPDGDALQPEPQLVTGSTRSRPRWQVPALIAIIAVVLAGGVVAVVLSLAGTSSTAHADASPSAPNSSASSPGAKRSAAAAKLDRTRGEISAQNGSTWTVQTKAGRTVTVKITSKTRFGSKTAPAKQSDFIVGTAIVVSGTADGDTVTARRIAVAQTNPDETGAASASSAGG